MRRLKIQFLLLGAVVIAAAMISASTVAADSPGNPAVLVAVPWTVAQVGRDQRSVELVYVPSSGCPALGLPLDTTVAETATTVTIGVLEATYPYENCANQGSFPRVATVSLAARLGGRRIVGPGRRLSAAPPFLFGTRGKNRVPVAPDLIGLAPENVLQAIRISGLRTHFCGTGPALGLPRAVSQRPAAGSAIGHGALIRVRVAGAGVVATRCR